jgi:hypothetical protein
VFSKSSARFGVDNALFRWERAAILRMDFIPLSLLVVLLDTLGFESGRLLGW